MVMTQAQTEPQPRKMSRDTRRAQLIEATIETLALRGYARATTAREVSPQEEAFSGFVFKIQANMDPKHRDRIAFLRVCSGRFERGMKMKHLRLHPLWRSRSRW